MALNGTMVKIETVTVGSGGQASIEFTNIPQTYTDLKLVLSGRSTFSYYYGQVYFNNSTTGYSRRSLGGDGSAPFSGSFSNEYTLVVSRSNETASTFGNMEIYIPNYSSTSTNKSFSVDGVTENNGTTAYAVMFAALWSNTAAITSIKLDPDSGDFAQYSTATLYGISRTTSQIKATGGMVYDDANYVYHLFTSSGTFTPSSNLTCEYLVVAGGGGGGSGIQSVDIGGGGGAGGFRNGSMSLTANTGYTVTVGAGGTANSVGSNSVFSTITSNGGGNGGGNNSTANGGSGGSGGGGRGGSPTPSNGGAGNTPTATPSQGNNGGNGTSAASGYGGGGGGGATAVGANGTSTTGGNGGNGDSSYSTWATVTLTGSNGVYAGGGGGGIGNYGTVTGPGTGGTGGGGDGGRRQPSVVAPGNGVANSGGGGGGGGSDQNGSQTGGSGGSGVVIVRYAK